MKIEDYDKEDLLGIAEDKGIRNITKGSKSAIIKCSVSHMLQPQVIKRYFLCLSDDEIREFEKAMKVNGLYEQEGHGNFTGLYSTAYVGMLDDGRVMIPKDVSSLYITFRGNEFDKERKKNSYLLCCLRAISSLYGIAPMSVLLQLMQRDTDIKMTEEEIYAAIVSLPPEFNNYVIKDKKIYTKELYLDDSKPWIYTK